MDLGIEEQKIKLIRLLDDVVEILDKSRLECTELLAFVRENFYIGNTGEGASLSEISIQGVNANDYMGLTAINEKKLNWDKKIEALEGQMELIGSLVESVEGNGAMNQNSDNQIHRLLQECTRCVDEAITKSETLQNLINCCNEMQGLLNTIVLDTLPSVAETGTSSFF